MTESSLIEMVIKDPLVREKNATMGPAGVPIPASPGELQTRTAQNLALAIGVLLMDQNIVRAIRESVYTLALTSATDYDLPSYIGRPMQQSFKMPF